MPQGAVTAPPGTVSAHGAMTGFATPLPSPLLVTGGAGFIGANFVHRAVAAGARVITLDALTYSGNRASLASLDGNPNHEFVHGSITDRTQLDTLLARHRPRAIVNFAAETHVDRSIDDPAPFVETNLVGTFTLLEATRNHIRSLPSSEVGVFRFLHVSTDEVYGSTEDGRFTERSPFQPSSPYAATKAGADALIAAYHRTYGLPTLITNGCNSYGPYQFPEKLVPLMILNCLAEAPLPVYGDGNHVREWLHAGDHCAAIAAVLARGRPGETYNVSGNVACTNLEIVSSICAIFDRLRPRAGGRRHVELITHVADRPAHDRRYAVDSSKLSRETGWRPEVALEAGLEETARWYVTNAPWWRETHRRHRGQRLGLAGAVGP